MLVKTQVLDPEDPKWIFAKSAALGVGVGYIGAIRKYWHDKHAIKLSPRTGFHYGLNATLLGLGIWGLRDTILVPRFRNLLDQYRTQRYNEVGQDAFNEIGVKFFGLIDYPDTEKVLETGLASSLVGGAWLTSLGRNVRSFPKAALISGLMGSLFQVLVNQTCLLRIRVLHNLETSGKFPQPAYEEVIKESLEKDKKEETIQQQTKTIQPPPQTSLTEKITSWVPSWGSLNSTQSKEEQEEEEEQLPVDYDPRYYAPPQSIKEWWLDVTWKLSKPMDDDEYEKISQTRKIKRISLANYRRYQEHLKWRKLPADQIKEDPKDLPLKDRLWLSIFDTFGK